MLEDFQFHLPGDDGSGRRNLSVLNFENVSADYKMRSCGVDNFEMNLFSKSSKKIDVQEVLADPQEPDLPPSSRLCTSKHCPAFHCPLDTF
jgi:hypothetical protein